MFISPHNTIPINILYHANPNFKLKTLNNKESLSSNFVGNGGDKGTFLATYQKQMVKAGRT